ncbi:alcohol dehydrogenase catalytic domain-containing protein [Mycobacterium yunnanensis]|uniref:Alcohol dehydrogenase catalytic domain-containing protein n=1 Tax=Mycobacterium yunnanensis TaxID=368477 RepID=A0A9X2Z0N3_9MYCO|nr:alcohol dehydrogenase catalytic domain-containing protein [Mycobacterium yunnanensis]MCV7421780.1 alcohol dehydrogenase catalytic domain-containing protein [Mycobacterium yunnanensis]
MRASVYHGAHDVRVEDVPEPVRKPGEALLRVLRSGVCGTDATEWSSGPKTFPVNRVHPVTAHTGPMIFGHEFVGEVVEAADDGRYGLGDVVASGAGVSCGRCGRCRQGRTNLCDVYFTLGLNTAGGMAEFVSVPERVLTPVPADMSLDGAGLAQPMAVGLHAARRAGAVDGDRVVLIGAGAIGSFVLAGLKSLAGVDVTVVDFPGTRLERAERLGAARTVAAGTDAVSELRGVEVVIEASGAPGQLNDAIAMVRTGGTILQVGLPSRPQEVDVHTLVMREISVVTTLAHVCGEDLAAALEILSTTDLASEVLESVHPLEDLPEQLELLATGKLEGKVLFDPRATTTEEKR